MGMDNKRGRESVHQNVSNDQKAPKKDEAELDVMRNCACSLIRYEPLSPGENILAAKLMLHASKLYAARQRRALRAEGVKSRGRQE